MQTTVVETRISPPTASKKLLNRSRLLDLLKSYEDYKLVLMSAGTGYGKTTLLVDFANQSNLNLCWYSLVMEDSDPAIFCRYLLYSIRKLYPNFGKSFEELLGYNLTQLHQEVIISRLVEEFVANLEMLRTFSEFKKTLIVLDDFQYAESPGVSQFMQRLIWWLPRDIHIIIATRSLPENLMITRLVAKQMMLAIGQDDLAFTQLEIAELLSKFYNTVDDQLVKSLASFSEGWITAVILLIGNSKLLEEADKDIEFKSKSFEAVFDYLASEVLENQETKVQNFLLQSSIFEVIDPVKCDNLLGAESPFSKSLLKQLEQKNLFISRLGGDLFQYHSLFRTFLLEKLKDDVENYHKINHRAAVLELKDNPVEAVHHFLEARDYEQAICTLNTIVRQLYSTGRSHLIQMLLSNIPETMQEQFRYPNVLSIKAQLLLENGENEEALKKLAEAEGLFQKQGDFNSAALTVANQAQILARMGKFKEASTLCEQVLVNSPTLMSTTEGQQALGLAKSMLGNICIEEGSTLDAEKNLQEASVIYKLCGDDFHLALIESAFGQLYHKQGRLIKSNIHYEKALAYFIKIGNRLREAYCRSSLATNRYTQGQYLESEKQFEEALDLAKELKDQYLQVFILTYLGNIYRDTGRYLKAETIYNDALQLAKHIQVRKMELLVLNEQATCYLLQEKFQNARDLIHLSVTLATDYNLRERLGYSYRNQGWLDLSNHSFKRASSAFAQAIEIFVAVKNRSEEIRTNLAVAVAWYKLGEPRRALKTLTETLEAAYEIGYEPFLPFELNWAVPLFKYAATKSNLSETVEEFLRKEGFIAQNIGVSDSSTFTEDSDDATVFAIEKEPIPIKNKKQKQLNSYNNSGGSSLLILETSYKVTSPLKLYALNGGEVLVNQRLFTDWRTAKMQELLFFLTDRGSCTRDEIFDALWPDSSPDESPHLLHTVLYHLRKLLTPLGIIIRYSASKYYMEGDIWCDALDFERAFKTIVKGNVSNLDIIDFEKKLGLYKRDYLDQLYLNWSLVRQQELLQHYLRGLEIVANYYQEQGQFQNALAFWQQLLRKDQYDESAHRAIIQCYLSLGNQSEAKLQFIRCTEALKELDLDLSKETTLLLKRLA